MVVVVVAVGEARVLARGGGAADRGALHLLQRLVAADVSQTAVAGAAAALGAVDGRVAATPQHVPRAEVADDRGAHLGGVSFVAMLGGMHHAVGVAGAGRRPPRRWFGSFPVPAGTEERGGNNTAHYLFIPLQHCISYPSTAFEFCGLCFQTELLLHYASPNLKEGAAQNNLSDKKKKTHTTGKKKRNRQLHNRNPAPTSISPTGRSNICPRSADVSSMHSTTHACHQTHLKRGRAEDEYSTYV